MVAQIKLENSNLTFHYSEIFIRLILHLWRVYAKLATEFKALKLIFYVLRAIGPVWSRQDMKRFMVALTFAKSTWLSHPKSTLMVFMSEDVSLSTSLNWF